MTLDSALEQDTERLDYARRFVEHAYEQGWTDGLPVAPVTAEVVEQFVAATPRARTDIVAAIPNLDRACTVEQAAVNAAMAGCLPAHFPVVLAAWDALMGERVVTGGAWQSTSGPAPLIIVNGPIRGELGINCTGGVLGPGFEAARDSVSMISIWVQMSSTGPLTATRVMLDE